MISEHEPVAVEMFSLFFSITTHLMPKQKQKVRLANLPCKNLEVPQSRETPNFLNTSVQLKTHLILLLPNC